MVHAAPSGDAIEPDLAALLSAETRLERVLDEARASAEVVRTAAAETAARDDAAAEAELAVERRALEDELAAATRAAVTALEAAAGTESAHWDALQGEALDRACARLLERFAAAIAEDDA